MQLSILSLWVLKKKKTTGGWGKGGENVFFILKAKNFLELENKLTMQVCPSIWLSLVLTCQPNTSLSHTVANVLLGFKPTVKAGLLKFKKKKKQKSTAVIQPFKSFYVS